MKVGKKTMYVIKLVDTSGNGKRKVLYLMRSGSWTSQKDKSFLFSTKTEAKRTGKKLGYTMSKGCPVTIIQG